jgi:lycopene beta-cyclase
MSGVGESRTFDIAILGGGLAGLSLALRFASGPLSNRRILIVDPEPKDRNDRTWCFWVKEPTPFDSLCRMRWDRLHFVDSTTERIFDAVPYHYSMLRGLDFYRYAQAELARLPCLIHLLGEAVDLQDELEAASFSVNGERLSASWVFDSRYKVEDFFQGSPHEPLVLQHFLGWEVEAEKPVFNPAVATLFDLRAPQPAGLGFFYILPYSPHRALVEYTQFSQRRLEAEAYRQALKAYLADTFQAGPYNILEEETGVIPMTARQMPRRMGQRILAIGTRGGRVKPSSGFAFTRIQKDSEAIVASLLRNGHPFDIRPDPARFRLYDAMLLDVLIHSPAYARSTFLALFTRNPARRLLTFLNEESTFSEDLGLMASVPVRPFLRALLRQIGA